MKPTRKQQLHENIREEIKAIAWKQLSANGASTISLGRIAREMGLTTPALYRYFPGREDLVTALIGEAYTSFTAALRSGQETVPLEDFPGRFRSLCLAYHAWAKAHPQHYDLIFGHPIPGYRMDATVSQAADQSFLILLEMITAAERAGEIKVARQSMTLPRDLAAQFKSLKHHDRAYSPRVIYLALVCWSFIHGMVSLELYGGYSLILADKADMFIQLEVERFLRSLGLE